MDRDMRAGAVVLHARRRSCAPWDRAASRGIKEEVPTSSGRTREAAMGHAISQLPTRIDIAAEPYAPGKSRRTGSSFQMSSDRVESTCGSGMHNVLEGTPAARPSHFEVPHTCATLLDERSLGRNPMHIHSVGDQASKEVKRDPLCVKIV